MNSSSLKLKIVLKKQKTKKIMTRAEKIKTKFIKRDSFDFEHVKVNLHRDDRDDRDERSNKEIKKFFAIDIATIMKTNIQTIEKTIAVIDRDVQAILTKAKTKTKTNISNDFIVNIDKTIIDVSNNEKFKTFIIDEEIMKEVLNMSK